MKTLVLLGLLSLSAYAGEMPKLAEVPSFELRSSDDKTFGKKELAGNVWVASFIFTKCKGQCPMLNAKILQLRKSLPAFSNLKFVSFSVDPVNDTPKVLAKYKKDLGADGSWIFLTGPKKRIDSLIRDGFKLAGGNDDSIAHSPRFVLVDSQGWIRGYYNATDEEKLAELKTDLKAILAEPKG